MAHHTSLTAPEVDKGLQPDRRRNAKAGTAVLIGSLSVQLSASLAVGVARDLGPAELGAMRLVVVGVALTLLARLKRSRVGHTSITAIGLGATIAAQVMLHYEAITRIPLASAVSIGMLGPISIAIVTGRRRLDIAPVVVVSAGLILLLGSPRVTSTAGVGFEIAAAACTAPYLLLLKRLGSDSPGLRDMAGGIVIVSVAFTPLASRGILRIPNAFAASKIIAIGVLSAVPYAAELSATRVLPVGVVGLLICADPATAAIFGFTFLHQGLSLRESFGIVLIVFAAATSVALAR